MAFDEVAFDERMGAAACEHDDQYGHQDGGDEEERFDGDLHGGEAQDEEDGDQHCCGGESADPHAVRVLAHRVNGFVEDHGFGAFTEDGEEAEHGERDDHAESDTFARVDSVGRVGDRGFGFVADVTVPCFHGALVEHPVAGP